MKWIELKREMRRKTFATIFFNSRFPCLIKCTWFVSVKRSHEVVVYESLNDWMKLLRKLPAAYMQWSCACAHRFQQENNETNKSELSWVAELRAIEILSSRKSFHCLRRRSWERLRSRMEKESFFSLLALVNHCFNLAALSCDWRTYDVCDAISLLNSIQFQLAWHFLFSYETLLEQLTCDNVEILKPKSRSFDSTQ